MRTLSRPSLLAIGLLICASRLHAGEPSDLPNPTISQKEIVFEYGNDLWIVGRNGGEARRLTAGVGREFNPHFSPDGTQVAFSGEYEGNVDVYVVGADGGVPRRLTYHPLPDVAIGWTPDGKRILFSSHRDSFADSGQLYTIALDVSMPEACRFLWLRTDPTRPMVRILPTNPFFTGRAWKHLLNLKTWKTHPIPITVSAELPDARPHFEKFKNGMILNSAISRTGQSHLRGARRNPDGSDGGGGRPVTNSASVVNRDPAWSPNGKSIAYFSDESGEYALHIRDQHGLGALT